MNKITETVRPAQEATGLTAGLRVVTGSLSLLGGLVLLIMELPGGHPEAYFIVFAAVLTAGGIVLLGWQLLDMPGWRTVTLTCAATALAGTAAGLLVTVEKICCMFAYLMRSGYPFGWLHRGAAADTPELARAAATAQGVRVAWDSLLANALFWAYAGLLVVATVVLARRALRGSDHARP